MTGVYSIAEVIDDSNKRPEKTIFVTTLYDGFFEEKLGKSLEAVAKMVEKNGGKVFDNLMDTTIYLNRQA